MEKIISLRFKYTEAECAAATRLYLTRSADFIIRIAVCVVYAIVSFWLLVWLEIFDSQILLLFLVAFCLPFIIGFLHLFVLPRQRFRRNPQFREEFFLQFSDEGLQFKTTQIDALLQWSLYEKVLEDERFYLLIYGKNMISVIPKRAFESAHQEAAFNRMLRRNVPAYANKRLAHPSTEPQTVYVPPAEPPDWR
jgi:hypothetical protein